MTWSACAPSRFARSAIDVVPPRPHAFVGLHPAASSFAVRCASFSPCRAISVPFTCTTGMSFVYSGSHVFACSGAAMSISSRRKGYCTEAQKQTKRSQTNEHSSLHTPLSRCACHSSVLVSFLLVCVRHLTLLFAFVMRNLTGSHSEQPARVNRRTRGVLIGDKRAR